MRLSSTADTVGRSIAFATVVVAGCSGGLIRLGGAAPADASVRATNDGAVIDARGSPDVGRPTTDATPSHDASDAQHAIDAQRLTDARAAADGADALPDSHAASDASHLDANPHDAGKEAGPTAFEIVAGRATPTWIVASDTSVYWSEDGNLGTAASPNAVMTAAKDGTGLAVVHADTGFPEGIALDGTNVYFLRSLSPGIELDRAPLGDGGAFAEIYTQGLGSMPGAVDSTNAYFAVGSGILRVPKAATMTTNVVHIGPGFGDAWEVAVDGTMLYVDDETGALPISALALPGAFGSAAAWTAGSGASVGVSFDTAYVFWTSAGGVLRVAKGGGATTVIAACPVECDAVVADDGSVVWATLNEVLESALDGTGVRTLASGFQGIHHAAMDTTFVYFTDSVGGGIWRVPR